MVFSSRIEHYRGFEYLYDFFNQPRFDEASLFKAHYSIFQNKKESLLNVFRETHRELSLIEAKIFLNTVKDFLPFNMNWIWSVNDFYTSENYGRSNIAIQIYNKNKFSFLRKGFPKAEIFLMQEK